MIIRGGFNVYPREIEEVLMTHQVVSLAAVVGVTWRNERRAVLLARLAHDPRTLVNGSEPGGCVNSRCASI